MKGAPVSGACHALKNAFLSCINSTYPGAAPVFIQTYAFFFIFDPMTGIFVAELWRNFFLFRILSIWLLIDLRVMNLSLKLLSIFKISSFNHHHKKCGTFHNVGNILFPCFT